jgi:multimeric flavodoxin WrbA
MGKKIVTLLLGSPRVGGNTDKLAEAFAEGAKEKGYEVRACRLAQMNLKGCSDCGQCWSKKEPCIINDDMDKIYKDIEAADVLVFVSPLYYFSWSAQIKPVWDRLLPYIMPDAPRKVKGKKAVLLAAAGDTKMESFESLKLSYQISAKAMGWENAGEVYALGIYAMGDMETAGGKYLKEARSLAASL